MTPCYNEEANVENVYTEIKKIFSGLKKYQYEHIFIDNSSKDKTVDILKRIALKDRNVKIIVNSRNFGHVRSPHYGILQGKGDAVIPVFADLQDPPSLILEFLKKWEEGYKIIIAVKKSSKESKVMFLIRKIYYNIIKKLSDEPQIKNFHGYGLYDKKIIEIIKSIQDPYPYFRGLITEIGFERYEMEYTQNRRLKGKSKNNLFTLYDVAILGLVNHSKVPLRIAVFTGFFSAFISVIVAIVYLVYKLIFWDMFQVGMAPLIIGFFFFISLQLIFIGVLGEYIGAIYTHVKNKPLVIEKERINFD